MHENNLAMVILLLIFMVVGMALFSHPEEINVLRFSITLGLLVALYCVFVFGGYDREASRKYRAAMKARKRIAARGGYVDNARNDPRFH